MRKRLSYLLVVSVFVSMLSLSGCGGGGGGGTTKSEANPYEGKWVAVVAEAMGVQLPIEECFEGDLSFELNSGGKVVFHADEETGNGKWAVADNKLTITIQGEEMVADVGENTFTFDDLMDMGLKVIFGKEGTDWHLLATGILRQWKNCWEMVRRQQWMASTISTMHCV